MGRKEQPRLHVPGTDMASSPITTIVASLAGGNALASAVEGRYVTAAIEVAGTAALLVGKKLVNNRIQRAAEQAAKDGFVAGAQVGFEGGRVAGNIEGEIVHDPKMRDRLEGGFGTSLDRSRERDIYRDPETGEDLPII